MPEGVAAASGQVVGEGVYDDPEAPPPPDVCARLGWDKGPTWDRTNRRWKAKVRGPLLTAIRGHEPQQDPEAGEVVDAEIVDDGPDDPYGNRDPDPSWQAGSSTETRSLPESFKVDAETRADIKALIALAYTIPGEALPLLDPYCFGPLAEDDTANGVISAVTDIVCGSPRVAKWAASATGLMPWIKLGMALKPVVVASFHHHVLKDVDVEVDRKAKTMTIAKRDWSQFPAA